MNNSEILKSIRSALLVPKKWGYERILANEGVGYCSKILTVIPNGMCCSLHFHWFKKETFHVIRGRLQLEIRALRATSYGKNKFVADDFNKSKIIPLYTGQSITLPPFTAHRFWVDNQEVCEFVEASSYDKPEDSIRLIESGPIPKKF